MPDFPPRPRWSAAQLSSVSATCWGCTLSLCPGHWQICYTEELKFSLSPDIPFLLSCILSFKSVSTSFVFSLLLLKWIVIPRQLLFCCSPFYSPFHTPFQYLENGWCNKWDSFKMLLSCQKWHFLGWRIGHLLFRNCIFHDLLSQNIFTSSSEDLVMRKPSKCVGKNFIRNDETPLWWSRKWVLASKVSAVAYIS